MYGNLYMDGNPTNDLFYRNNTPVYPSIKHGDYLFRTQSDADYMHNAYGRPYTPQSTAVAFMQSWQTVAEDKCGIPVRPNSPQPPAPPPPNR
jgi:hypothetical protein